MLIASIHDVAPPLLAATVELRRRLATWGVSRATLLAVPDYHGRGHLDRSPATRAWLRGCAANGDEIALHGVRHRQEVPARRRRDRWRAVVATAGEGEMLSAGQAWAKTLAAERDRLARLIDAPVPGFVAPAWLEPPGFAAELAAAGFTWHETVLAIEALGGASAPSRRRLAPVIGFATRSPVRIALALAWARAWTQLAARAPAWWPARVALHPADLTSDAVMRAVEATVRALVACHEPVTTAVALRG